MSILALRGKILSILSRQLKSRIPQFTPDSVDHDMVFFAYKDLITWLKAKWNIKDSRQIPRRLNRYVYEKAEELDAFLNFWVDQWLEKWRERVKILHKKPKIPKRNLERTNRAIGIYRKVKHLKDLEETVVRKLINQGEICMTEQIAKNLILEEIAKHIPTTNEKPEVELNSLDILSNLTSKIARLPNEKGPLVFLRVRTSSFW